MPGVVPGDNNNRRPETLFCASGGEMEGELDMQQLRRWIAWRPSVLRNAAAPVHIGSDEGQTLAEYALILALIAVIAVLALIFLGGTITSLFSSVGNSV